MRFTSLPASLLSGLTLTVLLTGCGTTSPCRGNADYLEAQDRPRLNMPEGVPGSERLAGGMVIPPPPAEMTKLDPAPNCLDQPPSFFGQRKQVAADSVEGALNAWAAAWAARNPDPVISLYSQQFQAPEGGAGPYLNKRREEVTAGTPPAAKLEDVKVLVAGTDRRIVTFVQRFGDDSVRRELTLLRETLGWRIVAERTL